LDSQRHGRLGRKLLFFSQQAGDGENRGQKEVAQDIAVFCQPVGHWNWWLQSGQ
jgi:hypothetical protein